MKHDRHTAMMADECRECLRSELRALRASRMRLRKALRELCSETQGCRHWGAPQEALRSATAEGRGEGV